MGKKVVILGAGPGGYVCAIRCAQLGMDVTVVEKDEVGGTCLNRGCIPTKALLASTEALELIKHASSYGIEIKGEIVPDMEKMMARKTKVVSNLVKGIHFLFQKNKVNLVVGEGTVKNANIILVTKPDGSTEEINTDYVVLATGSEPAKIPIFPIDGENVITSNEALTLQKAPESLLIIGAGAIGMEFASVFKAMGTEVTIVEMMKQPLPLEDEDTSKEIAREYKKKKIKIFTDTKIEKVEIVEKGKVVSQLSNGKTLETEMALVSIGRSLNTSKIGIEGLNLEMDRAAIIVNKHLQTSVPNVYAIGDITAGLMLAHKASAEGIVAAEHIAGKDSSIDYEVIPRCTFCEPEVASVGLSEKQAIEKGLNVQVGKFPFRAIGKAQAIGKINGFIKIIAEKETGKVVGAHMVGPNVTDIIAELAVAMRNGVTANDIAHTIHAHPTLAECVMEAAHGVFGTPIHN